MLFQERGLQMSNAHEISQANRYTIEVPIFSSYSNMPVGASARNINFSQDGMYFVSDMEFQPGSTVLIQTKSGSPHQKKSKNSKRLRQTTVAEVLRCRQYTENPTYYQVWVKYY
jgi:hypothetical protein